MAEAFGPLISYHVPCERDKLVFLLLRTPEYLIGSCAVFTKQILPKYILFSRHLFTTLHASD